MTVLVLGGTAEGRALAAELVRTHRPVVSSLAGRVSAPALPLGEVRIGGFGGAPGLQRFLRERRIAAVVDATHPFAATMSANAAAAAAAVGCPLVRLQRPGWSDHPAAPTWHWVDSTAEAVRAGLTSGGGDGARRPFLTTGRQSLPEFLPWADRAVLVRVVEPVDWALPRPWQVVRSRGPYRYPDERRLLAAEGVDLLVTKDSGGDHTAAKLDAAADLGVPVVVVRRPPPVPGVTTVADVSQVLAWLADVG